MFPYYIPPLFYYLIKHTVLYVILNSTFIPIKSYFPWLLKQARGPPWSPLKHSKSVITFLKVVHIS